jgi:hypothetical protein
MNSITTCDPRYSRFSSRKVSAASTSASRLAGTEISTCPFFPLLEEPMRILARNAGEDGSVIIDTGRRNQQASGDSTYGYNVLTGEFGSMLGQGVVGAFRLLQKALPPCRPPTWLRHAARGMSVSCLCHGLFSWRFFRCWETHQFRW